MKKYQLDLPVADNRMISGNATLLTLTHAEPLPDMAAGQFAELLVPSAKVLLRRPVSIHSINRQNNTVEFLIQIVGGGTKALAELEKGDTVNVVLPLGNGFSYRTVHVAKPLLIGGGVGVAPLLFLGQELAGNGIRPTFLFGGRSESFLLRLDEFRKYGDVFRTTEDGSAGEKGFVTNHSLLLDSDSFDRIYACGPTPMLKAVAKWAKEHETACEVSLEHKMACGIGACLCCVEDTADQGNVCVCKDGPVFPIERLKWQI
ncbi:MAG: dihydroorotate dehydrogenase electron transfer subunit [Bacteroidetes bacterium]|nr:dihydroorotate dehydrogenase electron transfer subunit [Candidatus Colenecus caballi]